MEEDAPLVARTTAAIEELRNCLSACKDKEQLARVVEQCDVDSALLRTLTYVRQSSVGSRSGSIVSDTGRVRQGSQSEDVKDTSTKASPLDEAYAIDTRDVNILIVDDDEIAAKLLGKKLERLHYQYEYVLTGIDAIEKLFANPLLFDLVLCDVNMPGLDGGQVLQRILQTPDLRNLPIVMISTDDNLDRARSLVGAGARDYLTKPIMSSILVNLAAKLKVWKAEDKNVSKHLGAVYETTHAFLVHMKVSLPDNAIFNKSLPGEEKCPELRTTILNASLPVRKLLGISSEAICKGLDLLDFVPVEDVESLKGTILDSIFASDSVRKRVLFRWISKRSGQFIPVVGTWTLIGDYNGGSAEMVVESKSLLPTLALSDEKEKRANVEKRMLETSEALERLRVQYDTSRKVTDSQSMEFQTIMAELSQFAKLVMENPAVLIWRVVTVDSTVQFVSTGSSKGILGFKAEELRDQSIYDTIHKDDVETFRYVLGDIGRSGRIRRLSKSGEVIWLESRSYSWWDKTNQVIVLTESDVTHYVAV